MAQAHDRGSFSLTSFLNDFRADGKYCDVEIRVGAETFLGHRPVLAAASKFFDSRTFCGYICKGQIEQVVLTDVNASAVRPILDFIYTGRLRFTEDVYDLLRTYDFLEVRYPIEDELMAAVEAIDKKNEPIHKAFTLSRYAQETERTVLAEFMNEHILKHAEHFFLKDDDIMKISHSHLKEMVERRYLPPGKEDLLADGVNRWINHSYEERRKYVVPLFSQVGGKLARNLLECYTAPFPKWTPSLFR